TLRPAVTKTFIKGFIAIAFFSLFLQVNPSKLVNYAIFLAISFILVLFYALVKKANKYVLSERAITLRPFLRAERSIDYSEIADLSTSQGFLAKRLDCGTVYIGLKNKPASYMAVGQQQTTGGMAEALRDVRHPAKVYEIIASRIPTSLGHI